MKALDPNGKLLYRLSVDYISKVIGCVKVRQKREIGITLAYVASIYQERIRLTSDVLEYCNYFFVKPDYTADEALTLKKRLKAKAKGT